MHGRIQKYASIAPFNPVDYTWVYFTRTQTFEALELSAKLTEEKAIVPFFEDEIANVAFPFEHTAIVVEEFSPNGAYIGSVYTVDRITDEKGNAGFIGSVAAPDFSEPVFYITDTHKFGTDPEFRLLEEYVQRVSTEPFHQGKSFEEVTEEEKERLTALLQSAVTALVFMGTKQIIFKDQKAYTCTGDAIKNAKRKSKGKNPFFEWKSIEVKDVQIVSFSEHKGGTHASPKPHERMGHWRTYKTGKKIFVRSSIVNAHKMEDEGFIFHDYTKKESNVAV